MRAVVAVLIAGCGRLGFEAVPDAAAPSPDAQSFIESLACEQDVVIASVPRTDALRWVDLGTRQVLAAILHLSNTRHELHAYAVPGGTDTNIWGTTDMFGLAVTATPGGHGLIVADATTTTLHVVSTDAAFGSATDTPIPTIGWGTGPFAESGGARLVAGRTAGSMVEVIPVDAALQPSTSASPIAAGDVPYLAPTASGFVLAYVGGAGCELVRLSPSGAITAGPLTIPMACSSPMVGELSTGVIAYSLVSGTAAYAGVADAQLATATTPVLVGAATDSFVETVLPAGDHAVLAVRTTGDSRIVRVAGDGTATALGSDFALAGTDTDAQTLAVIDGALIHAHTESGNLVVRKLCR